METQIQKIVDRLCELEPAISTSILVKLLEKQSWDKAIHFIIYVVRNISVYESRDREELVETQEATQLLQQLLNIISHKDEGVTMKEIVRSPFYAVNTPSGLEFRRW